MSEQMLSNRTALMFSDLWEMTKPKVVLLMLITAWVGMALAPLGQIPWLSVLSATLGIAFLAGSGAAFNHILDQHIDQSMARTHQRPVAQGRVSVLVGCCFATALAVVGFVTLYFMNNPLTAWLTLFAMVGYAIVYTAYLKRSTPQNIVIGGLAGAMPPLLGWVAVADHISGLPLLLVLIIFTWTPPHFWALAIHRKDDYARANVPMMPVTHGVDFTGQQVWLYGWLLLAVSMLPVAAGYLGGIYALSALVLGGRFLQWCYWLLTKKRADSAWGAFKFSITYLLYLFIAILVDHYVWSHLLNILGVFTA